jgi:hypothetical protein
VPPNRTGHEVRNGGFADMKLPGNRMVTQPCNFEAKGFESRGFRQPTIVMVFA